VNRKALLACGLAVTLGAAMFTAGCGDDAKPGTGGNGSSAPLVGVDYPRSDTDFWNSYIKYAPQFAKELGVELKATNSQNDIANLISNAQTFISQNVKGVVMAPQDTAAIAPTLGQLEAKKIPVVTIDTRPDTGKVFMVVRADNRAYGTKACQFLGTKLGGKGKVVMLQGDLASINGRDRTEAFNECMKKDFPGITVFGEATDWKSDVAASKLQTRFASDPEIKGIYMQSSFALSGTCRSSSRRGCRSRRRTRSTSSSCPTTASPRSSRTSAAGPSTPPSASRPTCTPSTGSTTSRRRSTARRSSPARPTTAAPSSRSVTACSRTSSPHRW